MKYLKNVYIRLSVGLILFPHPNNPDLFNWHDANEAPVTKDELKALGFVLLKNVLKKK